MENKLQALTDKLYKEGLSKGKEEGEAVLAKANEEAARILEAARKEAEALVHKAQKEAEEFRTKVEGDVKMAAVQSIQSTKKDLENLLIGRITGKPLADTLSSAGFIKEMLKTVVEKFNAQEPVDLNVILPEALRSRIGPFLSGEIAEAAKGGLHAEFSKKIAGGFNIGPKDGTYFISFTDETFRNLFGAYLRPATRKILFGE